MMGNPRQAWLAGMFVAIFAAKAAVAAADAPIVVADATQGGKRFISLAGARSPQAQSGARIATPPLRSDREALRSGFMRIDRSPANVVAVRSSQPIKPEDALDLVSVQPTTLISVERGVTVTRPQDKAVLDLFGDAAESNDAPAARSIGRTGHAWPLPLGVPQEITSRYGSRRDPFSGKAAFHGGVDIAASVGTAVLASADGTVSKVEQGGRLGKYVSVRHRDGSESTYGHLSAHAVRVGQRVRQGQKLGELGSTGRSTGPHLDYRITRGGMRIDPMMVLREPTNLRGRSNFASRMRAGNGVRRSATVTMPSRLANSGRIIIR